MKPVLILVLGLLAGCASFSSTRSSLREARDLERAQARVSQQELALDGPLRRDALLRAVLARNPSVQAALASWRAMVERAEGSASFPATRVEYALAPISIFDRDVRYGQRISVSQMLPAPGVRARREAALLAHAEAHRADVLEVRLGLAVAAASRFEELRSIARALSLNTRHRDVASDLKQVALDVIASGRGEPTAPLRAEVALARAEVAREELLARQRGLQAEVNALLHRAPEAPLPEPSLEPDAQDAHALADDDVEARPDLARLDAQLAAEEARASLAQSERRPRFGVMATYSSMWAQLAHQVMVGVAVEVPLSRAAQNAEVARAQSQRRAYALTREATVSYARGEAAKERAIMEGARRVLALLSERELPAAEEQLETARSAYVTGRAPFESLLSAAHAVHDAELRIIAAETERALASLRHAFAVGRIPLRDTETP